MISIIGWPLLVGVSSLVLVRAAMVYARRRGLFDQPGQRRSHQVATPRGGGIGVVMAIAIGLIGIRLTLPSSFDAAVMVAMVMALVMVAAVGWLDDHRPLGVGSRLGVQFAATILFAVVLLHRDGWAWWPVLALAGVWSINLHNFMDGIDGLLAQQGMFVGAGMAWLAWHLGDAALASMAASLAMACLGFRHYNRAPARIFMGDVGSGSIGLLIFAMIAMAWRLRAASLWPALTLCSAFVTDACLTLGHRMLHGRRWYAAHREHLYQWLARCGWTHAGSANLYTLWNLLVAAPLSALGTLRPGLAAASCVGGYLLAAIAWCLGKHHLRRLRRAGGKHVAA